MGSNAKRHRSKQIMAVATRDQAKGLLKEKGRELSAILSQATPVGATHILILADAGGVVFFTDGSKDQAVTALREVLAHLTDPRQDPS